MKSWFPPLPFCVRYNRGISGYLKANESDNSIILKAILSINIFLDVVNLTIGRHVVLSIHGSMVGLRYMILKLTVVTDWSIGIFWFVNTSTAYHIVAIYMDQFNLLEWCFWQIPVKPIVLLPCSQQIDKTPTVLAFFNVACSPFHKVTWRIYILRNLTIGLAMMKCFPKDFRPRAWNI